MRRTRRPARHTGDPDYMLSLARGLSVIRAFGRERPVLSIADVARLTSMSRAAARRCLHTLGMLGYVTGESGQYALAPRVLALGYAYLGSAPVAVAAQPVLERVADRFHESCSLAVLDVDEIVYVARAATRRILSVGLAVGSRLPAYCTSMGRVLLAYASDGERSAYLARVKPARYTVRTIVDRKALAAELLRVRAAGFALVDQELELGLRSMAVPVRRPDQTVVAAMNVGVQATRVECETMRREYLPVLLEAAEEVGLALAHGLPERRLIGGVATRPARAGGPRSSRRAP